MKYIYLATAIFFSVALSAQQVPPGYALTQDQISELPLLELDTFDHDKLLTEDLSIEAETGRTNFGRRIFMDMDANNCGTWTELPNGARVWRLRFRTAGALAVNVYMDDLFLPEGSKLFLYSADQSYFEGPLDHSFNREHGHWAFGEVFGDEAILEYYEPFGSLGNPHLGISAFGHFYRYIYDYRAENRGGGSDPCEVDVKCPEGNAWQAEADAVVRLTIPDGGFVGLCSASLVNTTAMDCRNYILSALHCAENTSDSDLLDTSVRFNYQRSGCGTGSAVSNHNLSGCIRLADSNDGGGASGSDFILLELESNIPSSWDPFYSGWDASGDGSSSGVSIHHPAGDSKKISTYGTSLTSVWIGAPGSHWQVTWMQTVTNWGVTEGGSSGSPIYNSNHKVVGTLTGGSSFCNDQTAPDFYGKMSKHFDSNPNASNQKLRVWLDPENTGQNVMFGAYAPCDQEYVGLLENDIQFEDISVFPSLSDNFITIVTEAYLQIDEVRIFDATGKMVRSFGLQGSQTQVDVSALGSGIYYITFIQNNGSHTTQKISKI